jgi:serine/threonine-protein kinase
VSDGRQPTELGRYRLLDKLGQGGMATVYRAQDPQLGREVAIKVMHPFIAEKSEAAKRFEREARAIAGLHHPNVLQLHDYQPQAGEQPAYLVMELLTGPSLRSFLDQNGTPFAEIGAIIGLRVAQALEAAHARDIVHRDVKPENVMFDLPPGIALGTASGEAPRLAPLGSPVRVVLCDFGIARLTVEGHTMTATGAVIGSPTFMSPEQARGEPTDARSDIFSLGSLLYVLSTGVPPFVATQPLVIMNKIAKGEHPPPTAKNPRVPRWLERTIEKCLQLEPQNRYAMASEVIAALSEGLRADGLGDFDRELESYLKDPPGYNEKFPARVVEVALKQMRAAAADKRRALALAAASRVLAWEPQQPEAIGIANQFEERPRWILPAIAGAIVLVAGLAAGGWVVFHHPPPLKPQEKPVEVMVTPSPLVEKIVEKLPDKPAPEKPKKIKLAAHESKPVEQPEVKAPEKAPEQPPEKPPEGPGKLTVSILPWCDLRVDGEAKGRAPLTVELPAGTHRLACVHSTGAKVEKEITIEPGKTEIWRDQLFADAKITPKLKPGVQFAVDTGAPAEGPRQATPGRHRITLFRDGQAGEARWLTVPPEGCRLVDTPELTCEKP